MDRPNRIGNKIFPKERKYSNIVLLKGNSLFPKEILYSKKFLIISTQFFGQLSFLENLN